MRDRAPEKEKKAHHGHMLLVQRLCCDYLMRLVRPADEGFKHLPEEAMAQLLSTFDERAWNLPLVKDFIYTFKLVRIDVVLR